MRKTIVSCAVVALALVMLAPPASAGGSPNFGHFTVKCAGIDASGRSVGWGGVKLVESAVGVPLQSVAIFWSGTQDTWRNPAVIPPGGVPDAYVEWSYPGPRPGVVFPCEGTLEWDFLGDHYYANSTTWGSCSRPLSR